jgi:hypothetical protein
MHRSARSTLIRAPNPTKNKKRTEGAQCTTSPAPPPGTLRRIGLRRRSGHVAGTPVHCCTPITGHSTHDLPRTAPHASTNRSSEARRVRARHSRASNCSGGHTTFPALPPGTLRRTGVRRRSGGALGTLVWCTLITGHSAHDLPGTTRRASTNRSSEAYRVRAGHVRALNTSIGCTKHSAPINTTGTLRRTRVRRRVGFSLGTRVHRALETDGQTSIGCTTHAVPFNTTGTLRRTRVRRRIGFSSGSRVR